MSLVTLLILGISLVLCASIVQEAYSNILTPGESCQDLLYSFAKASANYTLCSIQNARPITVCENCIDDYLEVVKYYEDILKLHDVNDKKCKEELMNLDRLQVVEKGYHYVQDLWDKASCSECFKKGEDGRSISNLTDITKKMLYLSDKTTACFSDHIDNSSQIICVQCRDEYSELNHFYDHHKAVCMDIVDMINITRNKWSKTFGCIEKKHTEISFLVFAGTLSLLPIVFYVTVYFSSKSAGFNILLEQNRWPSGSTNINS